MLKPLVTGYDWSPDKGAGLVRDMRVRWALEEVGQPFDVRYLSWGEQKAPAHRARHPFGQVPTYEEDGLVLFESGAIVLHIAETWPGLFPEDQAGRARAIEWIFAGIPERFPELKICLSEGGIGWVVGLMDRLDHMVRQYGGRDRWDRTPRELLEQNFSFCALDDPTTLRALRHEIGLERILIESDYPHGDSSWPDTQRIVGEQLLGMPDDDIANLTHATAAALYRHPLRASM